MLKDCQGKLKEIQLNKFKVEIEQKPKLRTFKMYKTDIETEQYLRSYINKGVRDLMSQFRCGILPLQIETERYKMIKSSVTGRMRNSLPAERVCQICKTNMVEDEVTFCCNAKNM